MTKQVARDETRSLISAEKVEGTSVYNPAGEKLGTVDTVMIDKRSGRVAYAVLSFGGFLGVPGLGDQRHPLPWGVLRYDTKQDGYVVDLDKATLENAPAFGAREEVRWGDETWNRRIHDYYGLTPFWL